MRKLILKIKNIIILFLFKKIPIILNSKKYYISRTRLHQIYILDDSVKRTLRLFDINCDDIQMKIMLENLFSYLNIENLNINDSSKNQKYKLINFVGLFDSKVLKVHQWQALYYITSLNGEFLLANQFRQHAVERALSYKIKTLSNPLIWDLKFRALLDVGDFDNAFKLLQKLKYSPWMIFFPIKLMRASVMTFSGNRYKNLPWFMKKTKRSNNRYLEFIQNKRIAVLGPAPSDIDYKDEINNFDIIIRLNYRGNNFLPDKDPFLKKIDVSYYNGGSGIRLLELPNRDFLNQLSFTNFKDQIYKLIETKFKHKFKWIVSPDISFLGSYNMIPLVIYDLLFYNPKSVKIFKTTFYISKNSHDPKYRLEKHLNESKQEHFESFTEHNPISQLRYVRNLFLNKIISVDEECEKVLSLSDEKYLEILENEYS